MEVHEHSPTSSILQKALKSTLPYSINLVYRTQHPSQSEHAYMLSTISASATELPNCWAAAYIDRSTRPGTELWLFAAGEDVNHIPQQRPSNGVIDGALDGQKEAQTLCPQCKLATLSLLDYMSTLPLPPLHPDEFPNLDLAKAHEKEHPESGPGVVYDLSPGTYMRHLLWPGVITLGACHHLVVSLCREAGILRAEFPGATAVLNKFLFRIEDLPSVEQLPRGLRWGAMRECDLPTVQARTSIPRATRTLMSLRSQGVFEEASDKAVAWTFLGLDGSLTTLHTEPEWRGKGIAKAVAARIIGECAPGLAVDGHGTAWSHADVYVGNVQSEKVCLSLGGKAMWEHYWVRIDLSKAGSLAKHASQA
ncbi:acetyltransferase [Stagonosporopsis vannaccii]|nr:acetyltransferase [Stagonosporopsis vannaccii]